MSPAIFAAITVVVGVVPILMAEKKLLRSDPKSLRTIEINIATGLLVMLITLPGVRSAHQVMTSTDIPLIGALLLIGNAIAVLTGALCVLDGLVSYALKRSLVRYERRIRAESLERQKRYAQE